MSVHHPEARARRTGAAKVHERVWHVPRFLRQTREQAAMPPDRSDRMAVTGVTPEQPDFTTSS